MDFLLSRGFAPFTTTEVAEVLSTKEYSVRAAVSWLKLGGYIKVVGWHESREHVRVYVWTGKSDVIETCRRDSLERVFLEACRSENKSGQNVQEILNLMRMSKRKPN